MAATLRIKDTWQEQRLFLTRVFAAIAVVLLMATLVIGRLLQLQVVQYEYFSAQSKGNRIRIQPVPPIRGLILDREGRVLAENTPSFRLELTPEQTPDVDAALAALARAALLDAEDIDDLRQLIASHRRFDAVAIRERLSDEEVARFAVLRPQFPGIEIRARLARRYPFGPATAHALGYMGGISVDDKQVLDPVAYAGTSHIGKSALERSYEDVLHGWVGHEEVLVNAHGRRIQLLDQEYSRPGRDIMVTLDAETQLVAHAAMDGRRGAVVAIDPNNGDVLALVSAPAYDPNALSAGLTRRQYAELQEDINQPLFNRALRGQYPPGSTIKPLLALAGLHFGTIDPQHRTFCRGYYQLPGSSHRYRDWRPQGHGFVSLNDAIAQSCDVFFYDLARELGIERMAEFLVDFGLGAATGIDVSGESPGLVPSPAWKRQAFAKAGDKVWFPGETVIAGIGQGYMLATPLQLASAIATVAARGKRYPPRLLRALREPDSETLIEVPAEELPPIPDADPAHWDAVIAAMHAVMHGPQGTARAVGRGAPFLMAGKSGTAQVFTVAQNERYRAEDVAERMRDHALFVAFAPVEAPRIAVAVIVENGESGSRVAAPVARQVMEAYLREPT